MPLIRYLISLMFLSAVASQASAQHHASVDGYQLNADTQHSILLSNDHQGDQPDVASNDVQQLPQLVARDDVSMPSERQLVAYYSAHQSRAPPYLLNVSN
ncbi:hypothetical protein [Idiomarina xiamenensis]|uniref:Uncharacterized protein n=1 Tax=Idiomarina xiamenensis 10-D-4 TaxID=740709 RepID=K2KX24_9GAMM|nr:hypothetical protein [Idiomarina xiamenensis]EKE87054.1 hypothetical protein A10D4_02392 [Idiomarina xiamenensis 10-D-4]